MQTAKSIIFTAPKQVEVRETPLPPLKEDEVLVETVCSAISAGTEMLVYRGQCPPVTDAHDALSSDVKYPLAYGYACVGRIQDIGKLVDREMVGRLVFAFHPHATSFILPISLLIPIPPSLSHENACFLPNMETAVNLVQDGAPIFGERVLVLGQGVVGLLTASLLSEFPLESLVTVDNFELRRKASGRMDKVVSLDNANFDKAGFDNAVGQKASFAYTQYKFDLTFELTGSPSALNDAIAHTAFSGRIVIGSWYGHKRAEIDLGGAFHRSRIKLIASQVSTISPELSGRWDKSRRFELAWKALEHIQPEKWITHRFSINDAEKAYQLLDKNPQDTIQVVFTYP